MRKLKEERKKEKLLTLKEDEIVPYLYASLTLLL